MKKSGMTVADLIKALREMPADAEVMFSYDYGDHCHTAVADPVRRVVAAEVVHSDYHSRAKVLEDGDETEDSRHVVVLR